MSKMKVSSGISLYKWSEFVGREKELILLNKEFKKLGEVPHKPIIIISGEAGIGKTRLLKEVRTILKDAVFIKVECQKEEEEPYACCNKVVDSLINLIEENYKEFIKVYGDILVTLSPNLKNKRYLRKVKPLKEIEKYYIFERFLQFIINLPVEKNIVIALEDSQYLRKEPIEFLKYLILGIPVTSNIIFLITYREEEKTDELIEFEEAIEGYFIKILLERLTIDYTREFITSMIGEIDEDKIEYISDKIFKKTAGVPLFIEHFVRLLIEEKALTKEENFWVVNEDRLSKMELTGTTLQIIQEKLKRVPNKKLMRVIQYASIMGGEYINSLILNEIMDKDIQEELETLNNQWILRKESIEGNERFKFAHPMIKEIAYQMIPEEKKKELHKKVGLVLEKHFPEEKAMLAYHFSLAGVKNKAYKYSLEAAEDAEGNFAYLDTIPLYEIALQFAPNEIKSLEVKTKLAELYRITDNLGKSIEYLEEVISKERQKELKIKAMVELVEIKRLQGESDKAFQIGEGVLGLIGDKISKSTSKVYRALGSIFISRGEYNKAMDYLEHALSIGDRLGDKELQSEAENVMGISYICQGENIMAAKHLEKALESVLSKKTRANICLNTGAVYEEMDEFEEAEFYYEKAVELYRSIGYMRNLAIAYNNLASLFVKQGKLNNALKYFKFALEYMKRIGCQKPLQLIYSNIGEAYAQINELDMAMEYCDKSLNLIKEEKNRGFWITSSVFLNAGKIFFYCGDLDSAILYYKKSIKTIKKMGNLSGLNRIRILLSGIYVEKGSFVKALDLLQKAEEFAKSKGDKILLGLTYRVRARIIKNDSKRKAITYLKDSLEMFTNPRYESKKALTLYEMGKIYQEMANYQDALNIFIEAKEILKGREQFYWVEKISKEIREIEKQLVASPTDKLKTINFLSSIVELTKSKISLNRFIEEVVAFIKRTLQIEEIDIIIFEDKDHQRIYSDEEIDGETQREIKQISKSAYSRKELVLTRSGLTLCIPVQFKNEIKGALYANNIRNQRPFEPETVELLKLLSSLLWMGIEQIKLRKEFPMEILIGEGATARFGNIVGESKAMQDLYHLIKVCSETDVSVLIEGETGVGKELVAKAIHYCSERNNNRFVPIYCGGMPVSLFESEFFGYVKGAFTGAFHNKPGLLEEADNGTIFLDEITSIPLPIQAKFLRVLQEGEFRRLGEVKLKRVDVRLISATNQEIEKLIRIGEFRKDLFYRISVANIKVPPLRERKEDIPLLSGYFLDRFNKGFGKNIKGFTQKAMDAMVSYSWPGNVRELEHEIERVVAICSKDIITIDDLKEKMREIRITSLKEIIQAKEKECILQALKQCNYNLSRTAKTLRISRDTLYRKIKEYEINTK